MKKYVSEFIGTLFLVLFGCGAVVIAGTTLGTLGIAFAFGLSIVAMFYVIGNISGCHLNPAVSFGMLISGRMSLKDFICYIISQFAGAIAGSALLMLIINESVRLGKYTKIGLGANGFGKISTAGTSMLGAIIVEILLTFVFVFTVLGVTSSKKFKGFGGLVIGLVLTLVHIVGIPLTGTSVNPARSLAPAIFMQGTALNQVWVFIVAPLAGAALAALVWLILCQKRKLIKEEVLTSDEDTKEETVTPEEDVKEETVTQEANVNDNIKEEIPSEEN